MYRETFVTLMSCSIFYYYNKINKSFETQTADKFKEVFSALKNQFLNIHFEF